jgi:CDP-glucose 4,6-dehydratase
MANYLVTGGNGLVGKKVLRKLLELGHTPIVLINDYNRKTDEDLMRQVSQKGAIVRGSITNKELIRSIVGKYELDYVIHLAAMPIVKICDADPYTAYNVNIMGTLNLYEAIRSELTRNPRLKKIIHMSTDKSYAVSSPKGGYLETTPFGVSDTYCTSKACGDMIAQSYSKTYNLPICIVRCGNLYGSEDLNLSRLIPGTILRLLNNEQPVLYTDAGEMIRDFIHVDDVVETYMTLIEKGKIGEAYNVGSNKMHRIKNVIELIRDKVNPNIEIKMVDRAFFEIDEQSLNSEKLRELGWTHKIELSEGLDEAIAWYTEWRNKVK